MIDKWSRGWERKHTLDEIKDLYAYYDQCDDDTLNYYLLSHEVKQKSYENAAAMINFSFGSALLPIFVALLAAGSATTGAWITLLNQSRSSPGAYGSNESGQFLDRVTVVLNKLWQSNYYFLLWCFVAFLAVIFTIHVRRSRRLRRYLVIQKVIADREKRRECDEATVVNYVKRKYH
ncbi:hypothetical protein JJB07_02850 [Tumebacillus sp. ITR2]|uniref:Uncharacterized protein n=1 Tax=Tumebacillus amylolyticus TaxID=2801339 RepID=A0ABS1J5M1_9BACL|nr:hypothetical protein [Tumebacillus amylolyticus]MBL0385578.1 hypothetical protein [Tumebacillus amylolyticus]